MPDGLNPVVKFVSFSFPTKLEPGQKGSWSATVYVRGGAYRSLHVVIGFSYWCPRGQCPPEMWMRVAGRWLPVRPRERTWWDLGWHRDGERFTVSGIVWAPARWEGMMVVEAYLGYVR